MKLKDFIKDNMVSIVLFAVLSFFVFIMGLAFKIDIQFCVAFACLVIVNLFIVLAFKYFKKKRFYDDAYRTLENLDQKYLISAMELEPDFMDAKILMDILYQTDKSMNERIINIEQKNAEFKEYLELWIHEIKLPIAALSLMNYNKTNDLKRQKEQISRVEKYVDQMMFYVRAGTAEKDYLLKRNSLEDLINKAIKENKDLLIENRVRIEKHIDNISVITDSKWLIYMLGQIISNSIKYFDKSRESILSFEASEDEKKVILKITDNGIGICEADLPRIFDKSFTGENGRRGNASTGMGLYICKKLCDKLGYTIRVESKQGEYTSIIIEFGKNSYYLID